MSNITNIEADSVTVFYECNGKKTSAHFSAYDLNVSGPYTRYEDENCIDVSVYVTNCYGCGGKHEVFLRKG